MDQAWLPILQYGALGLCAAMGYGVYQLIRWLLNRDKEREERMSKRLDEQADRVQGMLESVIRDNTQAMNRMVDLENRVIQCQEETTIILRDLGKKIGSGFHARVTDSSERQR